MKKKFWGLMLASISILSLSSCDIGGLLPGGNTGGDTPTPVEPVKNNFILYRSDTNEKLNNNDTLEIEAYNDFYFNATYNGNKLNIKSITTMDESIILPHSKSIYPKKEGNTSITISCVADNGETYLTTLNIASKVHNDIDKLYVGNGANGIIVDGNNKINITGKVFVKFKNNVIHAVNNDSRLTKVVENGSDDNHKRVTLKYSLESSSAIVSYDVLVNNTNNKLNKTEIKQTFNTYWDNGFYKNSNGHTVRSTGDCKILAIPIWFTDSNNYINVNANDGIKNQKEQIIEDLNQAMFGDPIRPDEYTLKSYYYDESFGQLNISGYVSDWYESTQSSSTNYFTNTDVRNSVIMDAYDWYKANNPNDTTKYDLITCFYGSNKYGEESNGYTAFKSSLTEGTHPDINTYIWCGALSIYNITKTSTDFYDQGDLSDLLSNDSVNPNILIHEFAHTMGAIDLYHDTRYNDITSTYGPAGYYGMQQDDTCGHDPYTMLSLGYASPYIVEVDKDYGTNELEITINDMQSSGDCIILTNKWNEYDSPFDEYIVIELFSEVGVNRYASNINGKCGIRVFHVDSRIYNVYNSTFTSDATASSGVIPFHNTRGRVEYPKSRSNYSIVSSVYGNMDLVHYIRKNTIDSKGNIIDYNTKENCKENDWFVEGDSFSMAKYKDQFYSKNDNEALFDNGKDLKLSFTVTSLSKLDNGGASATIKITKN